MAEETPLFNQRNGGERGGEGDELLVQMRGRCFNATLAVRKHVSRCPWCPDPNLDIQVVGGTAGPGQQSEQSQRGEALELHNALILALSGAVVFSLTGLCCVLCAHWRYRRRNNNGNRASKQRGAALIIGSSGSGKHTKKRILKQLVSQPRAQRSLPISPLGGGAHRQQKEQREFTALYGQHQQQQRPQQQGGPEEQRYDIPWDNKFCLVPRQWLVGSSQQPSVCDDASLAFSGGIEPLGRSGTRVGGEYATCAEFRAITSPAPGGGCGNNSMACRPPPPPPPPLPFMHRQSQPQLMPIHAQQQQQTFSPNTSGSSFGRQDDSGLDSV